MPKRSIPAKRNSAPAAPRRPPGKKREPSLIIDYAMKLHLPMLEARGMVQALILVGRGMEELGREECDAVKSVAEAAYARIEIIDELWIDFIQDLRDLKRLRDLG